MSKLSVRVKRLRESSVVCSDCSCLLVEGSKVFVVFFSEQRVAKRNNKVVLVQVKPAVRLFLCKGCFNGM